MVPRARLDLYWIPLGAGGHYVRFNGRAFEALQATLHHRARSELYHAALVAEADGERYAIELTPTPDGDGRGRGVIASGPVGSRHLAGTRLFRYEVRCWRDGTIPDLVQAVARQRLTADPHLVRRLLAAAPAVPRLVWGRDELGAGEMWNSNSVIAWLITVAGVSADVAPPRGGRAPGWDAGIRAARNWGG